MISKLRANKYYKVFLWTCFVICLVGIIMRGTQVVVASEWISADDFLGYWAAGTVNLQGGNPYDPNQLLDLQNDVGWPKDEAVIMWSPPWTIPFSMLFSLFSYPLSRTIWMMTCIFIVFISANVLWRIYKGSEKLRWFSWLLGFTFLPILDAVKKGQTGFFNLLGAAGFLFFLQNNKPWLAGASLALLVIKPHISYLLLLAAIIWIINRRAWSMMAGFISTVFIFFIIAWISNPNIINQYLIAVREYPPSGWVTPTVGGVIRLLLGNEYFWLQFLAPTIGVIWFLFYWFRNRDDWDWLEQVPLLIMVSILTAAYGWSFDQPVALVAIIQVFALLTSRKWNLYSGLIVLIYITINLLDLYSPPNEIWLWWLGPALLLWYLISRWAIFNKHDHNSLADQPIN